MQRRSREVPPEIEKREIFHLIMLRADLQNCASGLGGEHIFRTIMKTCHRKIKNVAKNHGGYIKMSPKWGRMHEGVIKMVSDTSVKSTKEAACSNNTHICEVF